MIRMAKFSKQNEDLKPIELLKKYDSEYPQKTDKEQMENLNLALNMFDCECSGDMQIFGCKAGDNCMHLNY